MKDCEEAAAMLSDGVVIFAEGMACCAACAPRGIDRHQIERAAQQQARHNRTARKPPGLLSGSTVPCSVSRPTSWLRWVASGSAHEPLHRSFLHIASHMPKGLQQVTSPPAPRWVSG